MRAAAELRAVRDAVAAVPDPELPPVTIGMLGMVHDVSVTDDGHVTVELLPTYSGCPATQMIERDVDEAATALPGVTQVTVRFRFDPAWHPGRISEDGREALRRFGIAPPAGAGSPDGAGSPGEVAAPAGRQTLPLVAAPAPDEPRACPYCGSTDTTRDSAYGPTPCRDVRFCASCQQPFEAFRSA